MFNSTQDSPRTDYKYLNTLGMLWLTFLFIATFTAVKTFKIFGLEYSVAIVAYPLTYIFADIFTEVYGYKVTRKTVWTGFFCLGIASALAWLYSIIPPSENFTDNIAFQLIFKATPVVTVITLLSFFSGELVNSYILAKLKIFTKGRLAELRYILSTLFGQLVDNSIFVVGVFFLAGFFTRDSLIPIIISAVLFCTLVEILMIPITRKVIAFIKNKEGIDTYDHTTNFSPFRIK